MSIIPLNKGNFVTNRVRMNPPRQYISSSTAPVTGALKVVVNRSFTQKDNIDMREGLTGEDAPQKFTENTFEGRRIGIYAGRATPAGSGEMFADRAVDEETGQGYNYELNLALLLDGADPFETDMLTWPPELFKRQYYQLNLNMVHEGYSDLPMHPRNNSELHIRRLVPGSDAFSSGSRALQLADRILEPYYSVDNGRLGSKYTNYNCFNFFSTDYNSAVVYSAKDQKYMYDDAFTIEFYVKAKHSTGSNCLLHLPGNYAVSVVSGSEVNDQGFPVRYKLQLQLDADALPNYSPDAVSNSSTKSFYSQENILPEQWHHCAIRYDSSIASGDFIVDNADAGTFSYTAATKTADPKALIIGAFWNESSDSVSELEYFFNTKDDQGVGNLYVSSNHPVDNFVSMANVDLHEIRMWNHRRSRKDLLSGSQLGISGSVATLSGSGMGLYIPLLYEPYAPENTSYLITGNVNIVTASVGFLSPYMSSSIELFDNPPIPFRQSFRTSYNTNQANIGGFCNVNIQAYSKEWIHSNYPYMHNLSESLNSWATTSQLTSSWQLISTHEKRNSFILPCDNGLFKPGYNLLSGSADSIYYAGRPQMINTKDVADATNFYDSRLMFVDECFRIVDGYEEPKHSSTTTQGADIRYNSGSQTVVPGMSGSKMTVNLPFSPLLSPRSELSKAIDQTDFVGNCVSVITIPQLFYGDMIEPESMQIKSCLYGGSKSEVILKDDGNGSIYRAQTSGSIATWNSVGDIYYKEGLIFLRNPSLFAVGAKQIDLEFQGRNYLNVMEINIPCPKGMINSSSNPNYNKLRASNNMSDKAEEFVYISTIYLHDENLNVVGKAKMAQPIIKRNDNRYLFRLRVDF